MFPGKRSVPVGRAGGGLVVQEDVGFAVSPVASHLQAGTDDEQVSATHTGYFSLFILLFRLRSAGLELLFDSNVQT